MTGEFIDPADPRWTAFLERAPHDFYHLPRYAELAARYEGGKPAAFYGENSRSAFLLPLLLRDLPAGLATPDHRFDAISPYGYPGPLATDPTDLSGVETFLESFRELSRERRIITAFVRLHPFFELPMEALERSGDCVRHADVVYVDLARSPEELWREMRGNHRTGINRLLRAGFAAVIDDWRYFDDFTAIYRATMSRVSATEFYYFTDSYFRDLRAALGERLRLCVVRAPNGETAAAGLFTTMAGIVQYHLGGTAEAYLRDAPSKLLFHAVCRWAGECGHSILNLGGGVGGEGNSLFHFKAGFSSTRAAYHTLRIVLDPEGYAQLARRWGERHADPRRSPPDFFPIYRYRAPAEGACSTLTPTP
jgi:hypothetical protein